MNNLFIGLVHYPVLNKKQETIITSITPFDVHDIARSAYSFGVKAYYVINPSLAQKKVVDRLQQFWNDGFGKTYNPNRTEALTIVSFVQSLEEAVSKISNQTGKKPLLVCTSAKQNQLNQSISFHELSLLLSKESVFLLFGTGWGLSPDVYKQAEYTLEPISGVDTYNHLSVRAAAAIILYQIQKDCKL